ncbi:MAG: CoA transferase [Paracoccus sp. (in: a-proteobacteria)]|uniref:CaiB/BaiF CoA transferase family protein n=1 Tax=Paracoccus sp. TaxID=267 RepID=UPI0039E6D5FC
MLPLEGIRVLALETYYAGNIGSLVFARFGADVIKIENPGAGDALRTVGPSVVKDGRRRSMSEIRVMGGKKSVAIDLRQPEGRAIFMDLVAKSDVVWSNMRAQSLIGLGLTFESLKAANPRIVYATLTGFGHGDVVSGGPYGDMAAFDIIAQGVSGLQMRGESQDGSPNYNGLAVGDHSSAMMAVLGTVLALFRRTKDGEAQRVDVAMHDAMVNLNELPLGLASFTGQAPPRGRSGTSAPFGAFKTLDGYVNIGVGGDPIWIRFCKAIGQPDLANQPEYKTSVLRVKNAVELDRVVAAWTAGLTSDEVVAALARYHIPCAPILDTLQVLESAQVKARNMVVTVDDPVAGPRRFIGNPIKMSGVDDTRADPAPDFAQHTSEVLHDVLGLNEARIGDLAAAGIVELASSPVKSTETAGS